MNSGELTPSGQTRASTSRLPKLGWSKGIGNRGVELGKGCADGMAFPKGVTNLSSPELCSGVWSLDIFPLDSGAAIG